MEMLWSYLVFSIAANSIVIFLDHQLLMLTRNWGHNQPLK